jgi:hypothetical protein
MLSEQLL